MPTKEKTESVKPPEPRSTLPELVSKARLPLSEQERMKAAG